MTRNEFLSRAAKVDIIIWPTPDYECYQLICDEGIFSYARSIESAVEICRVFNQTCLIGVLDGAEHTLNEEYGLYPPW